MMHKTDHETPSPVAIVGEPTQGATEGTPTMRQNRHLVSERVLEAGVGLHREDAPEKVEKEEKEHRRVKIL